MRSFGKSLPVLLIVLAWGGLMLGGFIGLERYAAAPGDAGKRVDRWPADSTLTRATDGTPTVVLSLHPLCPCTAATIDELEEILQARTKLPPFHLYVLRMLPSEVPAQWKDKPLPEWLTSYPGVVVKEDTNAVISDSFGLTTSGHIALYRADGTLAFKGGITASRGHRGENLGQSTLQALLEGKTVSAEATAVYGCSLK